MATELGNYFGGRGKLFLENFINEKMKFAQNYQPNIVTVFLKLENIERVCET